MKPELTQSELGTLAAQGKTAVWQYNTLYQIDYSRNLGNGEFYLRRVHTRPTKGMGVTQRGRFIAMTPDEAKNIYSKEATPMINHQHCTASKEQT